MTNEELKAWRAAEGLSLTEAAERLGVGRRSIVRWEKGDISVPEKVAKACGQPSGVTVAETKSAVALAGSGFAKAVVPFKPLVGPVSEAAQLAYDARATKVGDRAAWNRHRARENMVILERQSRQTGKPIDPRYVIDPLTGFSPRQQEWHDDYARWRGKSSTPRGGL